MSWSIRMSVLYKETHGKFVMAFTYHYSKETIIRTPNCVLIESILLVQTLMANVEHLVCRTDDDALEDLNARKIVAAGDAAWMLCL